MTILSNEIVQERINKKYGEGVWTILSTDRKYTSVHMKHLCRCGKCGNEYEKRVNDLLHGYGCSYCKNLKRRTVEEMKKYIKEKDRNYELISDHNRTRDISKFLHKKCNNAFDMKIHNFVTRGQRCPICAKYENKNPKFYDSKGILKIKKVLDNLDLSYEAEKKFSDCYGKSIHKLLPFDIYIEDLNLIIEYDGKQHFEPVDFFGGQESFERNKRNDRIKNDYCNSNNISMIRISYKQRKNIEEIIRENVQRLEKGEFIFEQYN